MVSKTTGVQSVTAKRSVLNMGQVNIQGQSRTRSVTPSEDPLTNRLVDKTSLGLPELQMSLKPDNPSDIAPIPTADRIDSATAREIRTNALTRQSVNIAETGVEILNAQFEFSQISDRAKTNIMLAQVQEAEAINIGRQEALRAETEGFARGEQALLEAVAQGQSVQGSIAQSSQLAEETFGVFNAMMIETNAIREAYQFDVQQAFFEHEIEIAEIQRDAKIFTSLAKGLAGSPDIFSGGLF